MSRSTEVAREGAADVARDQALARSCPFCGAHVTSVAVAHGGIGLASSWYCAACGGGAAVGDSEGNVLRLAEEFGESSEGRP